ncbi:hypothetical protein OEZ85_011885 [Tetradesmus obliquus]|uniref:Uncharacterized protein n=1 Tax=Tetradesmus obliquus TaxID=3088 RepID=A0ABY8TU00_TETOB|nr:hypothetical protein OEZ85_011885 [Tetradesmus obliquus]
MHTDHQGPASQDEERDSFLANIDRIKLHQDSYPDSPMSLSSRVHGAISQAQEGLGWLRHVMQDPEDVAAAAMGRMVSKEYGKHERPHTERHAWRSPRPSPPSSPTAPVSSPIRQQQQQQQQHAASPGVQAAARAWAGGDGSSTAAGEVPAVSPGSSSLSAADAAAVPQRAKEQKDM